MQFTPFFLDVSTIIPAGGGSAEAVASSASASGGLFGGSTFFLVAYIAFIGIIMYFFSIKPAKKKEKAMEELRNEIKVGDSVLLRTGMFCKVIDITYENFIVEFGMAKTVRVPVLKSEVYAKKEPNLSNNPPEPEPLPVKKPKK